MTLSEFYWQARPVELALPDKDIHVYSIKLDLLSFEVRQLRLLLSHDELERAQRFKNDRVRTYYIVSRAILRMILARYLAIEPAGVCFLYGAHGKPELTNEVREDGIRFNASRSQGLGIVAIQRGGQIGVDVEFIRPIPMALEISKRFFSPNEFHSLRSIPDSHKTEAFFNYWTKKEAVVKSVGQGLSYPLHAFTVTLSPRDSIRLALGHNQVSRRSVYQIRPHAEYVGALATTAHGRRLQLWSWSDPLTLQTPPSSAEH